MVDLLPRFSNAGLNVDLCVFYGVETAFKQELANQGFKIIELGKNLNVYSLSYLWRLWKIMRKGRYDIVHTHNTAPQLFAAIASVLCSAVLCTTEHNTSNRRRGSRWYAPVDRWMYNKYKTVICISDKVRENLLKHLQKTSAHTITIPNGIDVDKFKSAKPDEEIATNFKTKTKIMMVAGFRYQKNQPALIRAIGMLDNHYHLFLVGDGEKRQECEALVKELGLESKVSFLGVRSDVPQLLKAVDICVISSHWEGFGLVAVEAMAAGKPVIASDVPGLAEVVRGYGMLFEPDNPIHLFHQIKALSENQKFYNQIASKCKMRAEDFSIDTMAEKYYKVYKSLV